MTKASVAHQDWLIKWLKESSENQQAYLTASIEENSDLPSAILKAIRDVAEARGFENLAKEAGLSQKALYKILSPDKDSKPRYETISQILYALGLRLTVEPLERAKVS
jgi:probable addiction module antidote protein